MRRLIAVAILICAASAFAAEKPDPERKAILATLHAEMPGKRFVIHYLKSKGEWAFVDSSPCEPDGTCAEGGVGLMHKESGKWRRVNLPDDLFEQCLEWNRACIDGIRKLYPRVPVDIFPAKMRGEKRK